MAGPGDHRPTGSIAPRPTSTAEGDAPDAAGPVAARALAGAAARAIAVALLASMAWALLRAILELGVGLLAVAVLGGWGIGATLRRAGAFPILAGTLAAAAWLLGLIFTWVVALAILQGSSRTLLERLEGTSFLDWMSPQLGLLEIAGLIVYVGVAAYVSRRGAIGQVSRGSRP